MEFDHIEIIEVNSPREMARFIKFPFKLYKHDPNWVPPLISERKAFLIAPKIRFSDIHMSNSLWPKRTARLPEE